MSKSILNILDNDCIKTSPCKNCHWHIQGIEKNRCVKICQRLSAYRNGLDYDHLPWPELKDLQDVQEEYLVFEYKIPPKKIKQAAKSSDTLQKTKKKGDGMSKPEKVSLKPQKPKKPNHNKVFKLYMTKYPEIIQYIVDIAEKSLLPTKDVFIQLLSEAIIARKRKDGDKS